MIFSYLPKMGAGLAFIPEYVNQMSFQPDDII